MTHSYTSPLFIRTHRVSHAPPRPASPDPGLVRVPAYTLLTNDQAEQLPVGIQVWPEVLRYTYHGYRGLFGGIWRMGRTYFTHVFGACLGPEVFYWVGATTRESWAAFGKSRSALLAQEARKARRAFRFIEPIVRDLEGAAYLELAGRDGDRHVVHAFVPAAVAVRQFTPAEWFTFWRGQNDLFEATLEHPASPPVPAAQASAAEPVGSA
jgi:hypothetical protein